MTLREWEAELMGKVANSGSPIFRGVYFACLRHVQIANAHHRSRAWVAAKIREYVGEGGPGEMVAMSWGRAVARDIEKN